MEFKPLLYFAANEYNCGAYGAGAYNETGCTTSTGGGSTGGDAGGAAGGLSPTGMNMAIFLIIGVVLVLGSLLYIVRNLRKAKQHQ